jgi:hypothetical protein
MSGIYTNPYTRYSTYFAGPETDPYPYSGYIDVIGPSIARATPERDYSYRVIVNGIPAETLTRKGVSIWAVGTFCDKFQPFADFFTFGDTNYGKTLFNNSKLTFGKADCFILRSNAASSTYLPVYHQWGGPENDLAYDVASDDVCNATIFLRAGSDFGITSATQSLVRMKTGYNIVRLDTNGLLTETFPVQLEATAELTDTQIALGKNGVVYILAKDEAKKRYFLTKVSRSGTAWTRTFPAVVSDNEKTIPSNRYARMGLTVDSRDCPYITGNFSGTVDFGGASLTAQGTEAFVAKYSPQNECLGAITMGAGLGVTVRLSPDETALYVNGWAGYGGARIMGTPIQSYDDPRNGVLRPGAFLVKLKLTK